MVTVTCKAPFEKNPEQCGVCKLLPKAQGLKRCSRLVTESEEMKSLMIRTAPVAATDASVIIFGESGSGKEVLARAIHANSKRKSSPFLAVNVAALPSELLESELFGHIKGSFTGATANKQGLFEAAGGGTILLDEIAEMPVQLQAKLLRVLQDGEVRRVGDVRAFFVDVRVICATNKDLRKYVEEQRFREDLYYRLKVFTLHVPPLRERVKDIMPLARMFLEEEGRSKGIFTNGARKALESYHWPGNVRELANVVKHGSALSEGKDIDLMHLPDELINPKAERSVASRKVFKTLADAERDYVIQVLEACGGSQTDAARILGVGRTTLWRKLKALGMDLEK